MSDFDVVQEAGFELAQRELARRHLLPFIQLFNRTYDPGWVHKDVCRRLESFSDAVIARQSPRLMLFMPPRHGKSEIVTRNFPAWHLGRRPEHEVIVSSYSGSLAMKFSRKARAIVRDPRFMKLFPDCVLDETSQSAENWLTSEDGGYLAAGVGGGITGSGCNCLLGETMISTEQGDMRIDTLSLSLHPPRVLSYNSKKQSVELRSVIAARENNTNELYEIVTQSGRTIKATGQHLFFVCGQGYVKAESLGIGDNFFCGGQSKEYIPDSISSIKRISCCEVPVYDIQVEGNSNFFANEILTHNCGIIDDPVKNREEAESETTQSNIIDWYTSTFYTRLAPGGGILLIMTRWHDNDLAGWLLKRMNDGGDQFEIVDYPATAKKDELFRKKGDALHPARFPLPALEMIRGAIGERDWYSMYQQTPVADDGDYFSRPMFRFYRAAERPPLDELSTYTAWDLAIATEDMNDYTVAITVGLDRSNRLWLLDLVRGRWDAFDLVEKILDVFEQWNSDATGIEHGQIEMSIGPFLNQRIAERALYEFVYTPLKTGKRDKLLRARPIQGRMKQGMVLFPEDAPWIQDLMNEFLRFPAGLHDDIVDAFAWIGQMMNMFAPVPELKEARKPSWKDNLSKFIGHFDETGSWRTS